MNRRNFIKTCCFATIGIPVGSVLIQSCGAIYYANFSRGQNKIIVPLTEFQTLKSQNLEFRDFVLIKPENFQYPICLYKEQPRGNYIASLMKCTHNDCELNVGGGIYSCPCHGSEFSTSGHVLSGPADKDLIIFKTESDHEKVFIYLS